MAKRTIWLSLILGTTSILLAVRGEDKETPSAFAAFEYLIGSWKGTGIPTANRLKGWPEKHQWAWKFQKGVPVGMTVTIEGGKILKSGRLGYDESTKTYRLDGEDPSGKSVSFTGKINANGKLLTLDQVGGATDAPKDRVSIMLNDNRIRYSVWLDQKDAGAPQYKRVIDSGLTKEGEAFAAGSSAADLPKCIVTGGAAALSVSYQGKTYPLCCTGCRDEFNDNPEKYVKKFAMRAQAEASKGGAAKSVGASSAPDDGTFSGLVDEEKPAKSKASGASKKGTSKSTGKSAENAKAASKDEDAAEADGGDSNSTKADKSKKGAAPKDAASKAASYLRIAQSLEKSGKSAAALGYYKRIVKEYADTPQAKTAKARIKAIGDE